MRRRALALAAVGALVLSLAGFGAKGAVYVAVTNGNGTRTVGRLRLR